MSRAKKAIVSCPECSWPIDVPGVNNPSICYRCERKANPNAPPPAPPKSRWEMIPEERREAEAAEARRRYISESIDHARLCDGWAQESINKARTADDAGEEAALLWLEASAACAQQAVQYARIAKLDSLNRAKWLGTARARTRVSAECSMHAFQELRETVEEAKKHRGLRVIDGGAA